MTGSNQTQTGSERLKPVFTGSNPTRPAENGRDLLKPVLTGSTPRRSAKNGPDWLRPVLTSSNSTRPPQPHQTRSNRLKPDQSRAEWLLDRLQPVLIGSLRTRTAQTRFDQLKTNQTVSNRTQTGPDRLKRVLTVSNPNRLAEYG